MYTHPQKVLRIHELTFALPADFSGSASEAFSEFIKYRNEHLANAVMVDLDNERSTAQILAECSQFKVCGDIMLYELNSDGSYEILDGSFINQDAIIPML